MRIAPPLPSMMMAAVAELPENVVSEMVTETPTPVAVDSPPPSPRTELPEIVEPVIVSLPVLCTPPPAEPPDAGIVWFPEITLPVIVSVPRFSIAPFAPAKLFCTFTAVSVVVTLLCRYSAPPCLNEFGARVAVLEGEVGQAEGRGGARENVEDALVAVAVDDRVGRAVAVDREALLHVEVARAAVVLVGSAGERERAVDRQRDRVGARVAVRGTHRLAEAGLAIRPGQRRQGDCGAAPAASIPSAVVVTVIAAASTEPDPGSPTVSARLDVSVAVATPSAQPARRPLR